MQVCACASANGDTFFGVETNPFISWVIFMIFFLSTDIYIFMDTETFILVNLIPF